MKIIGLLFISIVVFLFITPQGIGVLGKYGQYEPCAKPIRYRIGTVDVRFNLTESDIKEDLAKAADIWNTAWGKPVLEYDVAGGIAVSFIYDERQALSSRISDSEDELKKQKGDIEERNRIFESDSAVFEEKLRQFNADALFWNEQGGAPPDVYEKLIRDQSVLRAEADRLRAEAQVLSRSAQEFNTEVRDLNSTIVQFNTDVKMRPELGVYRSADNSIEIYFYTTRDELIHTLTHEFGHSLGLGHVTDKDAMMYQYTTNVIRLSASDKQALADICSPRSYLKQFEIILRDRLQYLFESVQGMIVPENSYVSYMPILRVYQSA